MSVIVTRAGKGATLSWVEADANFTNLNNDKLEAGTPATNIAVTPTGGILATDVQAALAELDTELSGTVTKTASTGAAVIPTGTTANRPGAPTEGHFRRNSELGKWEGYDGSQWSNVGEVSLDAAQTLSNKTLVTTEVSGALDFTDAVASLSVQSVSSITFDADGIQAGSYKAGSIDNAAFADGILIENAPVGLGYGPGAGGTVTQATSKSTAVTLNKPCGQITMHNASLAANTNVSFSCNNSLVATTDVISISLLDASASAIWPYRISTSVIAGVIRFNVYNQSGGALAEAIAFNFEIIKGATS
jgi:hypothetical protein